MKRRLIIAVASGLVLLLLLGLYVALPVAKDLQRARDALGGPVDELTPESVDRAKAAIARAEDRLGGIPARLLRLVPLVGANLGAVEQVVIGAGPVLDAGLQLNDVVTEVRDEGFLEDGRIRFDRIEAMKGPLEDQIGTLGAFEATLRSNRTGALAPPLWDAIDDVLVRSSDLLKDAQRFQSLLDVLPRMLGQDSKRTYLFILMNNAELRGAGGLLSGVGTVVVNNGKLRLGKVFSVENLRTEPFRRVPAPEDYERRYGIFKANSTQWKNTSYSPDFTEVALVASRLFELVADIKTDGAIGIDPRGLEDLMPPDEVVTVPITGTELMKDNLSDYVYSDAYDEFRGFNEAIQAARRQAILDVGDQAFRAILEQGFGGDEEIGNAAASIGQGHLRFVSFDDTEQAALEGLGVTGSIAKASGDSVLAAIQNWGGGRGEGNKLDYWTKRDVGHACNVDRDGSARCSTEVTLHNETPEGLNVYVAGRPYGRVRNYVEIFIPGHAELVSVARDAAPVEYRPDPHADRLSVAVYIEIPAGDSTTIAVEYQLPASERAGYSLVAQPQPLTEEAELTLALAFPNDWVVTGPGETNDGVLNYDGPFDDTMRVRARPEARAGIPALWRSLTRFWREPLF